MLGWLPTQYDLEEDRDRDELAARLRSLIPVIMQRWEFAVRVQVPAARLQEAAGLHDDLPQILGEVAQALAIGTKDYCEASPASLAHAHERQAQPEYSLAQVIQEYVLLRGVVVETLRETGEVSDRALAIVHASLDQSIQESVVRYTTLQQQVLLTSEFRQRLLVEG